MRELNFATNPTVISTMPPFVAHGSIVRKIWGSPDTVLFIFAGAAAEFALNKSVDWLYFTGRLPADPINRLFSTVTYAHRIIFSSDGQSVRAVDQITAIHKGVEGARGYSIPPEAYRDVLFLLIYYSKAAYEVLERKMTENENEELFDVFLRVGQRMGLQDLPSSYREWLVAREHHLEQNLVKSDYTVDLYRQYRRSLGPFRYFILREVQKLIVPRHVKRLLGFQGPLWIKPLIAIYRASRRVGAGWVILSQLLPNIYKKQVQALAIA